MPDKLYTTREAAELLSISRQRVDQLVADGRIKPAREAPRMFTLAAIKAAFDRWPLPPGNPAWQPTPPVGGEAAPAA